MCISVPFNESHVLAMKTTHPHTYSVSGMCLTSYQSKRSKYSDVSHSEWEEKKHLFFYDHENGSRYPKLVSIHVKPVLNIQQSLGKVASMTP